jgi:hypothetical protein
MPPVTRNISDPRYPREHVLAKILLYRENDHLSLGLTAFGIKDITDFISMKLEDFNGLEYSFYSAGERPDDPAVEQVGSFPFVEIKKYIQLQQWYINEPDNDGFLLMQIPSINGD